MKHKFEYHEGFNTVYVSRMAECDRLVGVTFNIGQVHDPYSENPLLELYKPYGFNGVKLLMEEFEQWKQRAK